MGYMFASMVSIVTVDCGLRVILKYLIYRLGFGSVAGQQVIPDAEPLPRTEMEIEEKITTPLVPSSESETLPRKTDQ